jgi:hypothetical protein
MSHNAQDPLDESEVIITTMKLYCDGLPPREAWLSRSTRGGGRGGRLCALIMKRTGGLSTHQAQMTVASLLQTRPAKPTRLRSFRRAPI